MSFELAQQTFVAESRELLQDMEDALLRLEQGGEGLDLVNAVFRAAHTIKGTAGLFGYDYLVAFTHKVENLLDRVRAGEQGIDGDLVGVLLGCCDQMKAWIDRIDAGEAQPDAALQAQGQALLVQVERYLAPADAGSAPAPAAVAQAPSVAAVPAGPRAATPNWHISLRFGREVLRNGMDPLGFLRFLGTLGEIVALKPLLSAMPAAEEMDPECCYLGLEIVFASTADQAGIEGVFEFVRDDCGIRVLAPHSPLSAYLALLEVLREDTPELGEILVELGSLATEELALALNPPSEPAKEEGQGKARETKQDRTIRIDADRLDHLVNLVAELVIAGASADLGARRVGDKSLIETVESLAWLVDEVRDSALGLRMVPIGATFSRFQRVVRDVSRELGKDIELVVDGADTELDRSVVEKIGDPLTHLVRNSMDHGIESKEVRLARGKPALARVGLNAYHDSGNIVIEVSDDGGGLKRERIAQKAVEKGLIASADGMTDQEVYKLIFAAGFSTAEQVTNLSGRGVGMDVVRSNIEALRGSIELDSREGAGTVVRIRLPLTLAIIDGFLVGLGAAHYVLPLDSVVECLELDAGRCDAGGHRYFDLRGEVLPYVSLRELFSVEGPLPERENLLIVQYGGQRAGLVVDELFGKLQTVIKPLGPVFQYLPCVSGSSVLGSGEVVLILDAAALIRQAAARQPSAGQPVAPA